MKPIPNQSLVGLDNFTRKPDDEAQLNDLFQSVFKIYFRLFSKTIKKKNRLECDLLKKMKDT